MQRYPMAPLEMFRSAWHHRGLVLSLIRRDVLGRYRGSVMGVLWSFFNPLFMLGVYTFVFSVVFGLGHVIQGWDAAITTGLMGAFWGFVYLRRRSIVAPMVSHAGFNTAEIVGHLLGRR